MNFDLILVTLLLISTIALLASNRYPADFILLGAAGFLLVSGILTPQETLTGLSTPGLATIAVLFVIVGGLNDTGAVAWLARFFLGRSQNYTLTLLKLIVPAAAISAFINNTPVVAIFTNAVQEWCRRSDVKASRLLLPLSYASILGGTCTLIGTSTNLVVDGLMRKSGLSGFSLFELSAIGIPITIVGLLYLIIAGRYVLTEKAGAIEQFSECREYLLEMLVIENCELAGLSIQDAGLRHLPGLYLVEIDREGELFPGVSPQMVIQVGDRLIFAGAVESVIELRKIRGLEVAEKQVFKLQSNQRERRLFEAVIASGNPIIGQSIRDARFRHRYNAVILSVARNGQRLTGKVGELVLQAGDTLLLEAQKGFLFKFRNSRDFLLVSKLENSTHINHERAPVALMSVCLMLLLISMDLMSILQASVLAAALMFFSGCLSVESVRRSLDYQVLLVIACAFALGTAVQKAGLAGIIAQQALLLSGDDAWLMMLAIYMATLILTELITNNAAAIIMFPIAITSAESLAVSTSPFAVAVMIAASSSFITPIGYQTNLMVYGPGGYRYLDYIKLGLPLSILVAAVSLSLIPIFWPF